MGGSWGGASTVQCPSLSLSPRCGARGRVRTVQSHSVAPGQTGHAMSQQSNMPEIEIQPIKTRAGWVQ
jgi:hypothetical protein